MNIKQWIARIATVAAVAGSGGTAHAWYFPEHAVLTDEGLAWLPTGARQAIESGLADAATSEDKSALCRDLSQKFQSPTKGREPTCIPYGALAALAADHSSTEEELHHLLTDKGGGGGVGRALLAGSREQWVEFLSRNKKAGNLTQADRVDLVRDLDLYLRAVDSEYVVRAKNNISHFQAASERLVDLVKNLAKGGRVDNAAAQFVGHHLLSLQLAVAGRAEGKDRRALRLRAFLEHAYALHFLQDAFAAGHIVISGAYRDDPDDRIRRHDYYCRNGVAVTRALNSFPCALDQVGVRGALSKGLDACWITYGDGFIGGPGDMDRTHAAEAVARAQLQFAMALDPRWAEGLLEPAACAPEIPPAPPQGYRAGRTIDLTMDLLDPFPAFSLSTEQRRRVPLSCDRAQRVVKGALAALQRLDACAVRPFSGNTSQPALGTVCVELLGDPLRTCARPSQGQIEGEEDPDASSLCSGGGGVFLGSAGISLLRPILAVWPVPQTDPDTLKGSDPIRRGFGYQIWLVNPSSIRAPAPVIGSFGLGGAIGASYRIENFFPGRPNAASIELNAGLLQTIQTTPSDRFSAYAIVELRMPILSRLFWSAGSLISNTLARPESWLDVVPTGGRLYFDLSRDRQRPHFSGWDIEVLTFTLPQDKEIRGAERITRLPFELRSRVGCTEGCNAVSVSLEFAGGISRVF